MMMRAVVLGLSLSTVAALVCEDLPSCEGCVAKRFDENAPSCKDWGPKKCMRKDNKDRWEAEWCPGDPTDPCAQFPECDCVGEKAHGARKCLMMPRGQGDEDQCADKEANPNNPWVTTSWCASTDPPTLQPTPTAQPTTLEPTAGPTATDPPTAQPTTLEPTAGPTATDPPTAQPTTLEPTAGPTATDPPTTLEPTAGPTVTPPVANQPTAYIVDCFSDPNKDCAMCCPACEASTDHDFQPSTGSCACIDFSGDSESVVLSPSSDCARVTGNYNVVSGEGGDDAVYANGNFNQLFGSAGDDHLAAGGSGNILRGGGDNDVCTDLGDNQFSNEFGGSDYDDCETCFGLVGENLNCDTGVPIRRTLAEGLAEAAPAALGRE